MIIKEYPLESTPMQTLMLPRSAAVLTVQVRNSAPILWARIDETQNQEEAPLKLLIVGDEMPFSESPNRYIATFQIFSASVNRILVFHVFELGGLLQ